MKKFAPAATAVIMAALLTASCMTVAFAANDDPKNTAIDTTKKGSITLTKYDSTAVVKDETGAFVANPVKDAKFSAYKVLAYDATSGYTLTKFAQEAIKPYITDYNTDKDPADQITLDDIIDSIVVKESDDVGEDGYATYGSTSDLENLIAYFQAYITKVNNDEDNTNNVATDAEATTDENGVAKIGKNIDDTNILDLGVYLVVETEVPDGYIATTPSFLVSVPYWDQEAKEGEGEWKYNVEAYPKDQPYKNTVDKEIVYKNEDDSTGETNTDSLSIGDTVNFKVKGKIPDYGNSPTNTSVKLTKDTTIVTEEVYNKLPFVFTDELQKGLNYVADSLKIRVTGGEELTQDTGASLSVDGTKVDWSGTGDYYVGFNKDLDTGVSTLKVIIKWDSLNDYQGNAIIFTYDAVVDADAVVTTGNENTATITVANNPSTFDGDYSTIETTGSASSTDTSTVYTYQLDLTKKFNGAFATSDIDASKVKFEVFDRTTVDETTTDTVYLFLQTGEGNYTLWTGDKYTDTDDKTYAVVDVIKDDGTKLKNTDPGYAPDNNKYVEVDVTVGEDTITYIKEFVTGSKATSELVKQLAVSNAETATATDAAKGTLIIKGLDNKTYYLNEVATVNGYSVLSQPVPVQVSDVPTDATVTETTYYPFVAYITTDFDSNTTYYTKNGDGYTEITKDNLNDHLSTADDIKIVYYKEVVENPQAGRASKDVEATVVGGQVLKTAVESPEDASGAIPITVNNAKNQYDLPLTGGLGLWIFTIGGGVLMAAAIIVISVVRKKKSNK